MHAFCMLRRIGALVVAVVLCAAPVAVGVPVAGGQSAPGPAPAPLIPRRGTGTLVRVGVAAFAHPARRADRGAGVLPVLSHAGKALQPSASPNRSAVAVAPLSVPGGSTSVSVTPTDTLTSLDSQVAALGSDQGVEPPDTIVATSGSQLVEMVNDSVTVWSVSAAGALALASGPLDLNSFFYVPSGYTFSDPRVVYDPVGQRWIASGVAFTASGGSAIVLDVSATADATGNWTQYEGDVSSTLIHDQPKLGMSGEQVVLSWNDFLLGSLYEGATTWVFDRAGLESGSVLGAATFGPDSNAFSIVPASVVSGSTEYAVWNDADCSYSGCSTGSPSLGVVEIGGTPANNSVTWTTYNPALAPMSNPPAALQPAPGNAIDTDDDRLLGAVWSNNTLWTAGNDACTPPGDTAVRSCLRLIQVDLSASPRILQDFDAGAAGAELYYPAVALDGAGNLAVAFSASSASLPASVGTAYQLASSAAGTLSTGPWIESGAGAYVDGTSSPRWGDYSGAVAVPGSAAGQLWGAQIWVAGEYAAQAGTDDWGTAAAELSLGSAGSPTGANSLALSADPTTLGANSGETSQITATVTDSTGAVVSGDPVTFSDAGTCGTLSPTSEQTDTNGVAKAAYAAASTPGACTITASDPSGASASVDVTQVSNSLALSADPTTLAANTEATSQITATVTDSTGAVVSGDLVTFSDAGTCGTLSPTSEQTGTNGVAGTTYTAAKKAGTCTITASDSSGGSASVSVSQRNGRH